MLHIVARVASCVRLQRNRLIGANERRHRSHLSIIDSSEDVVRLAGRRAQLPAER